jgi:hypothetical protein
MSLFYEWLKFQFCKNISFNSKHIAIKELYFSNK